jgi:anion-transporting  ArsA/GET3 family ATPase
MTAEATGVRIQELLRRRRVVVCCGAGGVGKTTTSAALAIAAARAGRRVLVLTIDPSKRLAETLGVERNPREPVPLPADRVARAGIVAPGALDAWMLDHKLVADAAVRRLTNSPEDAARVLGNRIYREVSAMVAGMHEYTAMDALFRLLSDGRYDLIVLDTPPSRHALDFLDAPKRLSRFVESRALQAFLPRSDGIVARATSKIVGTVLAAVFGEELAQELSVFLATFTNLLQTLSVEVNAMRRVLSGADVAFLLVTSPAPTTLAEAHFFQDKARELELPFSGFVLNRSRALEGQRPIPDLSLAGPNPSDALRSAWSKLHVAAAHELELAGRDIALLRDLKTRAGNQATAVALAEMPEGADGMASLLSVAELLDRS